MKKRITDDLYFIAKRIKQVDRDYEVFYDTDKGQFVLYCKGDFCLLLGPALDKRAIDKAYSSHIRNAYWITREMEKNNLMLEEKEKIDFLGTSKMTLRDYLEYADGKGNVSFDGAGRTKWL